MGSPGRIRFAARGLGQDTEQVYMERLGLDPKAHRAVRQDGVI
jgi:hypothetical protein